MKVLAKSHVTHCLIVMIAVSDLSFRLCVCSQYRRNNIHQLEYHLGGRKSSFPDS